MSRLTPEAQAALGSQCQDTAGSLAELHAAIRPVDELAELKARVTRLEQLMEHVCPTIEMD